MFFGKTKKLNINSFFNYFKVKKAIITGASSGLGKEIGDLLIAKGYKIINLSRSKSNFENIFLDLSDDKSINDVIEKIKKEHFDFDLLILNAGIMPLAKIGEINFDIEEMFKVNIMGSIKLVNELINLIKKNKADIVFVGSTASLKGYEEHSVYCSSKHAVEGFIKSLQMELKDIRVIGFHPGGFNSNLRGGVIKEGYMDPKDLAKLLINLLELPKSMEVSEIVINRKKIN